MIWVFLTLLVLSYVFFFALIRAASEADEQIERSDIEDSHLRVVRGVYDHEAGGDFDDD